MTLYDPLTIHVRTFVPQPLVENTTEPLVENATKPRSRSAMKPSKYTLVIDTETTADVDSAQKLRIAAWQWYEGDDLKDSGFA